VKADILTAANKQVRCSVDVDVRPGLVVQNILQEHVDLPTSAVVPLAKAFRRLRILPSGQRNFEHPIIAAAQRTAPPHWACFEMMLMWKPLFFWALLALWTKTTERATLARSFCCCNNAKSNNLGEFAQLWLTKLPKSDPWSLVNGPCQCDGFPKLCCASCAVDRELPDHVPSYKVQWDRCFILRPKFRISLHSGVEIYKSRDSRCSYQRRELYPFYFLVFLFAMLSLSLNPISAS
jgi:hypothetical protein